MSLSLRGRLVTYHVTVFFVLGVQFCGGCCSILFPKTLMLTSVSVPYYTNFSIYPNEKSIFQTSTYSKTTYSRPFGGKFHSWHWYLSLNNCLPLAPRSVCIRYSKFPSHHWLDQGKTLSKTDQSESLSWEFKIEI